jgi:hypothetical protein
MVDEFRKGSQAYSSFDKENSSTHVPESKSNRGSVYDLKACAPQDETLMLRGKLNEELKKNNDLMLRVSRLE